jgi:hypothetical protein
MNNELKNNKITKQAITFDNMFEQMALITKNKLIEQGVLPTDANRIAIEFTKERGEQVIKNIVKNNK